MARELFTKSIVKPKEPEDSLRVSVMSRHTLDDGKTPDERIIEGKTFDEWAISFAPPAKLVGSYYRGKIEWNEYKQQYLDFLRGEKMQEQVKAFAQRCVGEVITLMCIEESSEKCHRRLLAEELQRYEPSLNIIHK